MRGRGPDKHRCPVRRRVRRTSSDKYLAAFVRGRGLLAAQNGLLPATESLVGPMYAPCPAAGSLFAFQQLLDVLSILRKRVFACLASSTQQMNSFRPSAVRSVHNVRTLGFERMAASRSEPAS